LALQCNEIHCVEHSLCNRPFVAARQSFLVNWYFTEVKYIYTTVSNLLSGIFVKKKSESNLWAAVRTMQENNCLCSAVVLLVWAFSVNMWLLYFNTNYTKIYIDILFVFIIIIIIILFFQYFPSKGTWTIEDQVCYRKNLSMINLSHSSCDSVPIVMWQLRGAWVWFLKGDTYLIAVLYCSG
jgi:hypothetical protein